LLLLIAADMATVAVLAGGVDRAYPAKHATLLERIAATGLVVESPCAGCPDTIRAALTQRERRGLARCRDRLWKLVRSCSGRGVAVCGEPGRVDAVRLGYPLCASSRR
jgi:hypothetical protein